MEHTKIKETFPFLWRIGWLFCGAARFVTAIARGFYGLILLTEKIALLIEKLLKLAVTGSKLLVKALDAKASLDKKKKEKQA